MPGLWRAEALAGEAGERLTQSSAGRHLGFQAMGRGELDVAGTRLEESLRLRREVGFRPGVAAALLALAELALETGERDRAEALPAEAAAEAEGCGAHGALRWVAEGGEQL